jgi:hypothetical protein
MLKRNCALLSISKSPMAATDKLFAGSIPEIATEVDGTGLISCRVVLGGRRSARENARHRANVPQYPPLT